MHSVTFYPRFAAANLKKNRSIYIPYIMLCTISIIMFYSINSLLYNPGINEMRGASSLQTIFGLGLGIIGFFSVILFFYTNSFLIKRRQKEFGLYNVLGMGKSQLSKTLFFENLFISIGTIILGLALGVFISRLILLLFVKVAGFEVPIVFHVSLQGLINTAILYIALFAALLIFNLLKIRITNPINMLKGGQVGEKEPKASWVLTIIGIIALAVGYYMAQTIYDPLRALLLFFIAVLLVIIGTFFLFLSGSIAFLKLMRGNKKFYYKPKNFIAVSGMIHRMKQNATGLTAICILSTMVLTTVGVTSVLYNGIDRMAGEANAFHINIAYPLEQTDAVKSILEEHRERADIEYIDTLEYRFVELFMMQDDGIFRDINTDSDVVDFSRMAVVMAVPVADVNAATNRNDVLKENEAIVYSDGGFGFPTITVRDKTFDVVEEREINSLFGIDATLITNNYFVIMKDENMVTSFVGGNENIFSSSSLRYSFGANIKPASAGFDYLAFEKTLRDDYYSMEPVRTSFYHVFKRDIIEMFSGFLFIGAFLGIIFLAAAAMIIYYKQISEGYQDHERFEIMQKVGMSKIEIKQTINKQILMVFFLPLVVAIIHIAFAAKLLSKMLYLFGLMDFDFFIMHIVICIAVFTILYTFIYKATAGAYYKLVG